MWRWHCPPTCWSASSASSRSPRPRSSASAREVGWALGMAPADVPWQRVVGADGYLRIAKRSPHLRDLQKSLLADEGVIVNEKGCVERRFFLGEAEPERGPTDLFAERDY